MTFDFKSTTNIIRKIENEFDVNSVEYNGISIWPLIRLAMYMGIGTQEADEDVDHKVKAIKENVVKTHLRHVLEVAKNRLYTSRSIYRYKSLMRTLENQGHVNCLFLSRTVDNTDTVNGKLFDRYVDPMIDFVRGKYTCFKVGFCSDDRMEHRYEPTFIIRPYERKGFIILNAGKLKKLQSLKSYSKIEMRFEELSDKKMFFGEDWLIEQSYNIELYTLFFKHLLLTIRPRVVFLVCYYSPVGMALIRACKQLKIKSVDIQHGQQGEYHPMYGHWTRIPEDGYELLPDYFWIWGDSNKRNILAARPIASVTHEPVVGGNRWIPFWKQHKHELKGRTGGEEQFLHSLGNYKRIILYACSRETDINDLVTEHVMDAIADSPKEWFWLVRLHPQHRNRIKVLTQLMDEKDIRNFDVEYSSTIPLYELFEYASNFVTRGSSASIEALCFAVPVIIVDPVHSNLYQEYIQNGLFSYAPTRETLFDSLQNDTMKDFRNKISSFVETSDEIAEAALETIMGQS